MIAVIVRVIRCSACHSHTSFCLVIHNPHHLSEGFADTGCLPGSISTYRVSSSNPEAPYVVSSMGKPQVLQGPRLRLI